MTRPGAWSIISVIPWAARPRAWPWYSRALRCFPGSPCSRTCSSASRLRNDFLNLWGEGQLPIKAVILVTHNIEEAVEMCDRLLIFSTLPARVMGEIAVDLPQPRHPDDPRFRALVDRVYVEMTAKPRGERVGPKSERFPGTGIGTTLTHVSSNVLAGLMEAVAGPPYNGKADLPAIAQELRMEIDDLF